MRSKRASQHYSRTDSGNAELFAYLHGDCVRFDHKQGRWLIWDKKRVRWAEDNQAKVRQMMKATARHRYRAALRISDDEGRRKESAWALQSESQYRIDAALELAKSEPLISDAGDGWDADPWVFGLANGIVDLRSGTVRAATQQDRITKFSSVAFNSNADCPRFKQFLAEIFDGDTELTAYLQKVVGYTLTGSTQEQCLFACYGKGSNGKSTLLGVLHHIFGDYAANLPFSALEITGRSSIPNDVMMLLGARFATAIETREGVTLNEARIKALTGGDAITGRRLYHEPITFQPTHKFWLAFNHKPIITDNSPAMWRRICLIPFLHAFEGQKADKGLLEKLKAEASGILNWLIKGCLAWQLEGLRVPASIEQATREYERESDALGPFLEDCCITNPTESIASSELWKVYSEWCKQNDENQLSRTAFADRLKKRGFTSGESGHDKRRVWRGLTLSIELANAGARVSAGAHSQNSSNDSFVGEVSGNGHPQTPADPQPLGKDAEL